MNWIDYSLYITYFAVGFALLAAVVGPLLSLAQDWKKTKTSLIGIVAMALIFFIAYSVSTGEAYPKYDVDEGLSRQVSASLITFYIMFALAFLFLIYAEISKLFK